MIDLLLGAWPQIIAGLGIAGAFLWTFIAGGNREKNKRNDERLEAVKDKRNLEKEIADEDRDSVIDINTRP